MLHHPCLHTPPSICRSPILHQSLSRSHSTSLLADGLFLSQSRLSPSFTVSLFFTISSITRADCHVLLSPVCPFQACSSSYFVSAHQARSLFPFSRFPQPPSILPFGFSISSRILTAASSPHLPPLRFNCLNLFRLVTPRLPALLHKSSRLVIAPFYCILASEVPTQKFQLSFCRR